MLVVLVGGNAHHAGHPRTRLSDTHLALAVGVGLPRVFREAVVEVVRNVRAWLFPRLLVQGLNIKVMSGDSVDANDLIKLLDAKLPLFLGRRRRMSE